MARPGSRSRRYREEEEDEPPSRRGGRSGPAKPSGPPAVVLLGGVAVVVLAVGIGLAVGGGKKTEVRKPAPVALAPAKKFEEAPVKAEPPVKPPPRPLTPEERTWIDGLFKQAEPHIALFRKKAREGWDLKKQDDMEGANAAWVVAKKECHTAIELVNEALEDYDKFSAERQEAYLRGFTSRVSGWQNELAAIPKVDVGR